MYQKSFLMINRQSFGTCFVCADLIPIGSYTTFYKHLGFSYHKNYHPIANNSLMKLTNQKQWFVELTQRYN